MSCEGSDGVVLVELVVEPVVVRLHPTFVPVPVADVQVVVRGVAEMYEVPSITPPLEYSPGCIVFRIIMR